MRLTAWFSFSKLFVALLALGAAGVLSVGYMAYSIIGDKPHPVEKLLIQIKPQHMAKLSEKRRQALALGTLIQGREDYVPAQITHAGRTVKARLRLKGDWTDHIEGDKWSYRIKVKNGDHLFDMRRFSIQSPETRNFAGEIVFFQALRREGILTPRYFFVDVTINGKHKGLMAFEEHFSKELLESQGRRESVILKFDESVVFLANDGDVRSRRGFGGAFDNYKSATILPFRSKRIARSKRLSSDLESATGLLRGFVEGTLAPSEAFDAELLGRFIAVADSWGAWHALRWHNLRFYYNPMTHRLEPIGYDAQIPYNETPKYSPTLEPIIAEILQTDHAVHNVYQKTLQRLADDFANGKTEKWVTPLMDKNLDILRREYSPEDYPQLTTLDLDRLAKWTQSRWRKVSEFPSLYPRWLNAYSIPNEGRPYLELRNPLPLDVEVLAIELMDQEGKRKFPFETQPPVSFPIHLARTPKGESPTGIQFSYRKPPDAPKVSIKVTARIAGQTETRTQFALPYYPPTRRESGKPENANPAVLFVGHIYPQSGYSDEKNRAFPNPERSLDFLIQSAREEPPLRIIFGGDNVDSPTPGALDFLLELKRTLPMARFIAGNHDRYRQAVKEDERWATLYPRRFYYEDVHGARMVYLHTVKEDGTYGLDEKQRSFLKEALQPGNYNYSLLFLHHALWTDQTNAPYPEAKKLIADWKRNILPVLEKGKTLAVFSGDGGVHREGFKTTLGGIAHYVTGWSFTPKPLPPEWLKLNLEPHSVTVSWQKLTGGQIVDKLDIKITRIRNSEHD